MLPYCKKIKIQVALRANGDSPFEAWLSNITDIALKKQILARMDRVILGNFGDFKSLGEGVYELRIHYGGGIEFTLAF